MIFLARLVFGLALQPPPASDQFVPATGAATEHLPAAPLLVAAYAFVWIAAVFYIWTIWRRLHRIEADLRALERRQGQRR
jgi:CcmD family protein